MKKLPIIIFLLSCISTISNSQPKIQFGITTEGSWFMPQQSYGHDLATKAGFGTGIGVYASRNIFWRFSADVGLAYRYKQMQQHYVVYTGNDGGYDPNGYGSGSGSTNIEGWDKLPMHSLVVPIHLRLHFTKNLFVKGGIESAWLLNYEAVNEKPEFNWTVGLGSDKHKLRWSLNYIKGFKDQGFGDRTPEADGHYKGSIYRNNMLQLSLSYPIWQSK